MFPVLYRSIKINGRIGGRRMIFGILWKWSTFVVSTFWKLIVTQGVVFLMNIWILLANYIFGSNELL